MKKLISLALCLIMCAAVFSPAYATRITDAQMVYAKGGGDALWSLVNTHYGPNLYLQEGYADLYIWTPDGPAFPTETENTINAQTYYKVCMQETAGVGFTLEQIMTYVCEASGDCHELDETGSILPDGPVHIDPCGSFSYTAGCPALGNRQYEIIIAAGTDDNGHPLEFYGIAQRLNILPADGAAANPLYDTENLRYEAHYEVEVADGVWWVPTNILGGSRYTNREIAGMVEHNPEEKQAEISTLYEALQLFQISNFHESDDNVRIKEGKVNWEHHKPGYDAVRTNNGCCASDSNWLNYILDGDYEGVGFIAYSQPDGSGHIFNYILQDGYYYFIDLTHYRTDFLDAAAPETGRITDYKNSDFVAGNLHRVKDPEDYISYCIASYNAPPARFFLYQAADCLPLDGVLTDGQMTITYPEGYDILVMDGKDPGKLDVAFVKGPKKKNKWASLKNAEFRVDEKFLSDEAAPDPLTSYKAGDRLTLEDHGANGYAVIDGIEYNTCRTNHIRFGFEENIALYGGNNYSYFDYELPRGAHRPLADMESVVLGDICVDISKQIPETQIVICIRKMDMLVVQEVIDGKHYDSRKLSIRQNENGTWPDTPEYWYLLIGRSGNTLYEFGRIRCRIISGY